MTRKQIEQEAQRRTNKFKVPDNNLIAYEKSFVEGADWALSNQWVSVEYELPPQKERYSGYVIMRNRVGGHYIGCYDFLDKLWLDGNLEMIYMDITHWMPIPQMTEEGGNK